MRQLDSKFHIEGDKIVKTSNGDEIPLDEPVFLLRGRDRLALPLLHHYLLLSEIDECTNYHLNGIGEALERFQAFYREHLDRMKQPGITSGR